MSEFAILNMKAKLTLVLEVRFLEQFWRYTRKQFQHWSLLWQKSHSKVCFPWSHTMLLPSSQTPECWNENPNQQKKNVAGGIQNFNLPLKRKGEERKRWRRRIRLTTRLLPPSISILFPRTTNGKFSGSVGLACPINQIRKVLINNYYSD